MRRSRLYLLGPVMAVTLALLGCGGGGGGSVASGPVLDLTADDAAMTAIETKWSSAVGQGLSLSDQAKAVLAAMQADPRFVASGISSDNTVWGRFKDGVTYALGTNDVSLEGVKLIPSSTKVQTPASSAMAAATAAPASGDLPGAAKAYVFDACEPALQVPVAALASELQAAGYSVVRGTGLLTEWEAMNGAGVVYSSSHGGNVPVPLYGETYHVSSGSVFDLGELQYPVGDTLQTLIQPLSLGHLCIWEIMEYNEPPNPAGNSMTLGKHFAFDSYWLTTFGSPQMFTKNSMIYLDACSGMSAGGAKFGRAIGQTCGLGLYASWSNPVSFKATNESVSFFFDRALGLNQFAPVDPSDPPPGDLAAILATMASTPRASGAGYNLNRSLFGDQPTLFGFQKNDANLTLTTLIPSIASDNVDVNANTLALNGSFGPQQGTATLDGTALTIQSWNQGTITITQPTATTGKLQVVSPAGLKSNLWTYAAPTAVWKGTSYAVTNEDSFPIYDTSQVVLNEFQVDATHVYFRGTSSDSHGASYILTCGSASAPATVTSNGDGSDSIAIPSTSMVATTSPFCSTTIPPMTLIRTPTQLRYPGASYTWSSACSNATTRATAFTLTKQ